MYNKEKIKTRSEYLNGKKEGYYKGWYPDGNKQFERFYKNGQKVGKHIGWYKNNKKKFEIQFNNKGNYNGFVKEWYINGNLSSFFNYLDGKENGSQMMWQPNGKVIANYFTKNGERFGLIGLKKCYSISIKNEDFK